MKDEQIIALYWDRDEHAIRETNIKYGAYCFSVAHRILNSREDSEECVSDTWLRAWNAMPPKRPDRLRLFLARITRNLSFDRYRLLTADKRGRGEIAVVLDELAECLPAPTDVAAELEAAELEHCINRFLHSLTSRESDIFLRRYFFAESVSQIAVHYTLQPSNVLVILSRTRQKLKAHLQKEGFW